MAAYLIANVTVKDPAGYEEYKARVPALIRKHGGDYLVRGGRCAVQEGNWKPSRLIVVRFPDMASAEAFYNDSEYQSLKALRQRVADGDIILVEA
jgi:uncharacterized protein (DUF1330 family)